MTARHGAIGGAGRHSRTRSGVGQAARGRARPAVRGGRAGYTRAAAPRHSALQAAGRGKSGQASITSYLSLHITRQS